MLCWFLLYSNVNQPCAVLCLVAQSCPTLCNPMDRSLPGSSVRRDSPGKNTGVGCYVLLQEIITTQRLNPGLLHCRWILYCHFISLQSLPPLSPSHLPRSSQSAGLGSLCYIATSHQPFMLHMIVYICHCYLLHLSPSPTVSTSPFSTSASPFLPSQQIHQYHFLDSIYIH